MNKAVVITADEWEGLFVNGKCEEEGHTLNQGQERILYFLEAGLKYNFDIKEVVFKTCTDEFTENYLNTHGNFPENIEEVEVY